MCVCIAHTAQNVSESERQSGGRWMDASSNGCTCGGSKRTLPSLDPHLLLPHPLPGSSSISCHAPNVGQWQNVDFNVAVA